MPFLYCDLVYLNNWNTFLWKWWDSWIKTIVSIADIIIYINIYREKYNTHSLHRWLDEEERFPKAAFVYAQTEHLRLLHVAKCLKPLWNCELNVAFWFAINFNSLISFSIDWIFVVLRFFWFDTWFMYLETPCLSASKVSFSWTF